MTDTISRDLPPPPPPPGDPQAKGGRDIRDTPLPVVAFVAGLVALGFVTSWWLVAFIVLLVVMIFLHELGHYVAARRGGMKVTEFFIGFGPRLWSFRRGETEYGLKAIPAGAYVKVIGMTNLEEVAPEDEARTYRQATYPRRMAVALAGSFMHFVQAFVILMIIYVGFGAANADLWHVRGIVDGSAAAEAGMVAGDRPISVDGHPIEAFSDLGTSLADKADTPVTFTWERGGETMTGTATIGSRLTAEGADAIDGRGGLQPRDRFVSVDGQPVTSYSQFASTVQVGGTYEVAVLRGDSECSAQVTVGALPPTQAGASGFLGVQSEQSTERLGVLPAVGRSVGDVGSVAAQSASGIVRFLSPSNLAGFVSDSFQPKNTTSSECRVITQADERRALSIIGIGRLATDAGSDFGGREFLVLFAMFNIFIGLFNLLPTLPFDGGHAVIATYERIRSRNGKRYFVDIKKLMPLAYGATIILVTIGVLAMARDIYDPLKFGG